MNFSYRLSKTERDTPASSDATTASRPRTSLKELKVGDAAQIVDFFSQNEVVKKIEAMGLRKGKKIKILQKLGRGIVVKTSNSRIVITSDVAKNIEVK